MEQAPSIIMVTGDICLDHFLLTLPGKERDGLNWQMQPKTLMVPKLGGMVFLTEMIREAVGKHGTVICPKVSEDENQFIKAYAELDVFPRSRKSRKENNEDDNVIRVKHPLGFNGYEKSKIPNFPLLEQDQTPTVVVLDDANNGFRGQDTSWLDPIIAEEPIVILKMFRKLADGNLWHYLQKNCHDRLIVVINADDLRTEGMKISKRLSWDRTAMDFCHYITENKAFAKIAKCSNLIVRFGLDGAILYRNSGKEIKARLFFDPKSLEGDFSDRYDGSMIGHASVFIAAVCAEIAPNNLNALNMGIRKGLEASRRLLRSGFGKKTDKPVFQVKELFESQEDKLDQKNKPDKKGKPDREYKPEFVDIDIPLPQTAKKQPLTKKDSEDWSILDILHKGNLEYIAYEIVCNGDASSLQKVPIAEYGKFKTVDRSEIESFQSIKNLMREYLRKSEENRPLSIAVFGPPGSGKSFGVTELAESLGDERIERKTFNLAQFRSMDDLVSAFHKIRDLAITGKVPLVFFDEFDAYFENTKLGWLKYFLAPMQDGEFKEREETHPIGRAIFVFAGGTSFTFESFQGEGIKSYEERKKFKQEFADAKGTDFVSRLKGFVNILGINPKNEDDGRKDYIIRRAVLRRALLEKKAGHLIENRTNRSPVDQSVFFALINTHKYKHGSRSMEAIIDMSMLQERKVFEPAALPSLKQLEMHVNADNFMNLLMANINWDWESNITELAKQIHKHYLNEHSKKTQEKTEDDRLKDWDDLEEYLKESNLRQAEHIPFKLRTIGYDIYPATTEEGSFQLDDSQKNKLAIIEHDRWMNERVQQGWQYGDEEDNENMISPDLKPWLELEESVREKDRLTVANIPTLLHSVKLEVHKQEDYNWKKHVGNLAKAIHIKHIEDNQGKISSTDEVILSWEKLDEVYKNSNIEKATQIIKNLKSIGYGVRSSTGRKNSLEFEEDVIALLAAKEHDRWVYERIEQGWKYGDKRDSDKKINPLLKRWNDLKDEDKNSNRNAIHRFLEIMAEHDLEVYYLLLRDQGKDDALA